MPARSRNRRRGENNGANGMDHANKQTDEWVEEEHLVLVELTGVLDYQYFAKSDNECKILGLETDHPVLQVGSYIFKGDYKKTVGTAVFFEQDKENSTDWKFKCCTDKMLEMKRVFLQPHEGAAGEQHAGPSSQMETKSKESGS